ncbi:hypothetical protein [Curtobacterium sp. MCJR17_043]|uniref:hypothetical protein n=1 Tax=Curtobacterium sp. MCJR17_043 TaxID=2175660 RepID=UPI0032E88DF6
MTTSPNTLTIGASRIAYEIRSYFRAPRLRLLHVPVPRRHARAVLGRVRQLERHPGRDGERRLRHVLPARPRRDRHPPLRHTSARCRHRRRAQ